MKHNWEYIKLDELALIKGRIGFRGYTKNDLVSKGEGAITLSPTNIVDYKISYEKCQYISWYKYEESPEIMIYDGDIIFAKTASIGKVAIVKDLPEKATINPQFVVLKDVKCLNEYLYYVLRSSYFKQQISLITNGVAIPTVSQSNMGNIPIPVPPKEEQKEIASLLDKLNLIIEKKKQQVKELDKLAQAIFYDMFGDPVDNNKAWPVMRIKDICAEKKEIKRAAKCFNSEDTIQYIDISSIDNVTNIITDTTPYVFGEAPSRAQQKVEKGDILVSLVRPNLKNIAVVNIEGNAYVASSGFCILRTKKASNLFIKALVLSHQFTKHLSERVSGANYPAVKEDDIKECLIGVPPFPLQQAFAEKIEAIERQKDLINQSIQEAQTLFDSRMEYYFGE